MKFDTIGFVGLGLIGGSIAKKIKYNKPDTKIFATAHRVSTIEEAYKEGIIENESLPDLDIFHNCDIIFLCAPVQENLKYLRELKSIIKPECIITDVGSTKGEIHREVINLQMENQFIGGHPMTGSEKTGIQNANRFLLENAYYIITPTSMTEESDVITFKKWIESFGAIPMVMNYEAHDYATASISHLPHMIAFSLVNLVRTSDDSKETMKTIAAGGFKDITRIASSSPVMWENICSSNKDMLVKQMNHYIEILEELKTNIENNNSEYLLDFFGAARDYRDSITVPSRNSQLIVHEIYLDLADEAGGIATIAGILANNSISIKNIGIINNREFEDGVLRIEFYENNSKEKAIELLNLKDYHIYNR